MKAIQRPENRRNDHSLTRPVLTQTESNTTLWLGHLQTDSNEHLAGQTFNCPTEGTLDNIQVLPSSVQYPGEVTLTLHEFDADSKTWGPAIAETSRHLEKNDESRWVRFELDPLQLRKNSCYGFRLKTPDAFIGLGEAVHHAKNPFDFGQLWNADTKNEKGHYFSFFSMAFKVEMCA